MVALLVEMVQPSSDNQHRSKKVKMYVAPSSFSPFFQLALVAYSSASI